MGLHQNDIKEFPQNNFNNFIGILLFEKLESNWALDFGLKFERFRRIRGTSYLLFDSPTANLFQITIDVRVNVKW